MPKFILKKIEVIFPKLATIKNMCLFWDYFSNFITHSKIILFYIDFLTSVFFFLYTNAKWWGYIICKNFWGKKGINTVLNLDSAMVFIVLIYLIKLWLPKRNFATEL